MPPESKKDAYGLSAILTIFRKLKHMFFWEISTCPRRTTMQETKPEQLLNIRKGSGSLAGI